MLSVGIDSSQLESSFQQLQTNIKANCEKLQKSIMTIGIGMTAVGVAGTKLVDSTKELNARLGGVGITIGKTTKEMRDLALKTTDVGLPLREVINIFDALSRAGMRSTEDMQATAKAFDALSHVTSGSADTMTEMLLPAFKALGMELPKSADDLDSLSWLAKNTMVTLEDFASAMSYVAREGAGKLNVTMNDMVALLAVLESRGITGSAATRTFRSAVTEAANSGRSLNDVLKISQTEIAGYNKKLADSAGITKKYADQAETQYGFLDKLKQKFSEVALSLGTFLEPFDSLLGSMALIGPAIVGLTMLIPKIKIAFEALKLMFTGVKLSAVAMWGAITLGVSLAIAAAIELWQNWDKVTEFFRRVWTNIKIFFLTGIKGILDALSNFTRFIPGLNKVVDEAREKLATMIDAEKIKKASNEAIKASKDRIEALEEEKSKLDEKHQAEIDAINEEFGDYAEIADFKIKEAKEVQKGEAEALDRQIVDAEKAHAELLRQEKGYSEKLLEELNNRVQVRRDALDKERADAQSAHDKEVDDLRKKYGVLEGYDEDYTETLMDSARRAREEREKEIDKEMDAKRAAYDESIEMINREYDERLKLIDSEAAAEISGLNEQIDAIRRQQESEDKVREAAADAEKKAELQARVAGAKTDEERIAAQRDLADFMRQLEAKTRREERDALVDSLRNQIDAIRASAQEEKDRLREEQDAKIAAEKAKLDATLATLQAEKDGLDTALQTELVRLEKERQEYEATAKTRLDTTLKRIADENAALDKQLEGELAKIRKHVDDINAATAQLQPRTVSITTVHQDIAGTGFGVSGLPKMAGGGIIPEPTLLYGLRSLRPYAVAGEAGIERVSPMGGASQTVYLDIHVDNMNVRNDQDVDRIGQAIVDRIRARTGVKI